MGIAKAISVPLFHIFALFLVMLYSVLQTIRKTTRSLISSEEEELRSTMVKRRNSFEDDYHSMIL